MSSSYGFDIAGVINTGVSETTQKKASHATGSSGDISLDMNDYLLLMVEMLKNQDIDNTADMSEMMGQMVQMSVVQAITDISSLINESTALNYAASLVGKEVTIGQYEGKELKEIVGTITGTGTMDGEQVVFIGDDIYNVTDIMAVGRLPSQTDESENTETETEDTKEL